MTFSNTTGFDLPIDESSGSSTIFKKVVTRAAGDSEGAADARTEPPAAPAEAAAIETQAAVVADIAVDAVAATESAEAVAELRPTIEPDKVPLPPRPKQVVHHSRDEICDTLAKAAQTNNLPVPFFIRLLFQESGFKPGVVSSAGAEGIAQFMPETSASEGLRNPFDPLEAIPVSARFLAKLLGQFGNLGLAAAAYNAGPKRIQDWLAKKGSLPHETQGYVRTVTGRPAETWRGAKAGTTALTVPHDAPCKEAVPPMPPPVRTIVADNRKAVHHAKVAAAAPKPSTTKPAKPAAHKTAPVQQLAARTRKPAHKVAMAQR